jgi:7,8-dihydropterin-6-yl-methyl-4-(beta-D-ribofuranosyl)aminobenzene 5'-phosphate synthase
MLSDTHIGEWGFSAIIEADGERILFDTGSRENTVLLNAEELNIDLGDIKDVFLSHNHSDHTGGLISLKKTSPIHFQTLI